METKKSFDYRTLIRDPKTKQTIKEMPYRRYVIGRGIDLLERPPHSQKFFFPDGESVSQNYLDNLSDSQKTILGIPRPATKKDKAPSVVPERPQMTDVVESQPERAVPKRYKPNIRDEAQDRLEETVARSLR